MQENYDLPTFRVTEDQYKNIYGMFAGLGQFEIAEERMAQRIKAIPNGKRDLHLLLSVGNKLMRHIIATVPEEKREAVKRQAKHTHFDILIRPRMRMVEKNELIVAADDLHAALYFAHEQCKMCFKDNCRSCKLGKALDHLLGHDRNGGSWAGVDFSGLMD